MPKILVQLLLRKRRNGSNQFVNIFFVFWLLFYLPSCLANNFIYYYRNQPYSSLAASEAAMRTAHANDSHNPRVDALAVYYESLDPATGRLTYYYKINLPEAIDATIDREFWYKWGWPLMHSEEDTIFKLASNLTGCKLPL
ncbi:MAG: hypothetical protein KZQ89_20855 [Candidatus Thiodiazotropha sp. (ex Lucinoma kastoroae)]|nr:hypothetical protein [Candidatus Thiodiazotropha sp. (ex Lucinoma kastoroae)]